MRLVRSGRKPIQDEFTGLRVSDQRKYQLRHLRDGLCIRCSRPRCEAANTLCLEHWQPLFDAKQAKKQEREQERIKRHWDMIEYQNKLTEQRPCNTTIPLPNIMKKR